MVRARRSASPSTAAQHMYFLEGGFLVVSNLLKTDMWVHDGDRSHCNVCVQQFMAFRRRHHCRTCGEVVCGSCSSQRKIHLTEVNVECVTRVCSFCMIRATDASISTTESVIRETLAMEEQRYSVMPSCYQASPPCPPHRPHPPPPQPKHPHGRSLPPRHPVPVDQFPSTYRPQPPPPSKHHIHVPRVSKQHSMLSIDSELTDGSVVQLWPNPIPDNEHARLEIVRNSIIRTAESDPTMNLLVSIVARTLECPVAFIGILDDDHLLFKATTGWDRSYIARDDCVCALLAKTVIVGDTNVDKHFHANTLTIGASPMRYYAGAPIRVLGQCIGAVCAIDMTPHATTSPSMRSTLEAVANIVSEVLEQRVDNNGRSSQSLLAPFFPATPTGTAQGIQQTYPQHHPEPYPQHHQEPYQVPRSSCGSESTLVDYNDTCQVDLHGMGSSPASSIASDGDSVEFFDQVTPPVHPWPAPSGNFRMDSGLLQHLSQDGSYGASTVSMPRFSMAVSMGPSEVGDKIGKAMEFFQRLQSSHWNPTEGTLDIRSFKLFTDSRSFTKSHARLTGDCTHVIAHVQSYDDARVYSDIFRQVGRRQKINVQTWVDCVDLRAEFESPFNSDVRVLSHWRQYPDGSNVIVAFNDTNPELLMIEDFLFGWFVAPAAHDKKHGNSVNVSCIVAQPNGSQNQNAMNLSLELLKRLQHSLPFHYDVGSRTSISADRPVMSSSILDNQRSNDRASIPEEAETLVGKRPRGSSVHTLSTISTPPTTTSTLSAASPVEKTMSVRKYQEGSSLNDNERMLLDLLDKTISTQEVLAAQQHVMANVMDYHGSQLQRISSAIDRVETMLSTNGDHIRRLQLNPHEPRTSLSL
ncbi:hypothetical protein Poli38472_013444 [Pythium oligandrum]|uniref:FYVE-type domain-containing protein n=1 Tax=Pythium oligandrum TaxID=41045 RepID=A0A8K1C7P3_PYTOL|nr:hypothetical protein Poli38472_013444 [Pythium oligandrum]|eukprot:TMW57970.1 hypothetical protein Poli38472_013444 [Pythium oligandrum]